MTLFFTADTHVGDHRTINIHRRPFADVEAMDAAIIAGWNGAVGPEDEIWHRGDVARRSADVTALLARLNGIKHLVRGNNDDPGTGNAAGWASVQDYAELTQDGVLLVLCHYPFRSWNGQHRRSFNLHGHTQPLAMDVTAGELAGAEGEQWQGVPDLAFKVEHAVGDVVHQRAGGAVDVTCLAAFVAIGTAPNGAAVRARLVHGTADRSGEGMPPLHLTRDQPGGHCARLRQLLGHSPTPPRRWLAQKLSGLNREHHARRGQFKRTTFQIQSGRCSK
jgi:calcineurin-like phosphoesterase family protein